MKEKVVDILEKAIKKNNIKLDRDEIYSKLEIPPNYELGDFAFPCYFLSRQLRKDPHLIALEIRKEIGNFSKEFDSIETSGAYINFFINKTKLAKKLINEINISKEKFGKGYKKKEKIMIEFSQANTHKAFHVGHIRGTSIGESLARIFEFRGYKVIRANYQGDTGMHIAKWLWAYKKFHSRTKIKKDEKWIASIYVDAIKKLGKNKKELEEVAEINRKLGTGEDKELNKLWKKTRKYSLESFEEIYKQLNTKFDVYFFESEMEKQVPKIIDFLLKKKIAKISDGAVIINLKKYDLGVWVLLRKDKTILYAAKDIALAIEKFEKYKTEKNIYVVGEAQSLHLKQLFKTLELMSYKKAKKCSHVSYSEIRLPTGKMSSRTGENILYSDFINSIQKQAEKNINKSDKKLSKNEKEKRISAISLAAIKYSMLKQTPCKNIIFKKEDALNFEGNTGPYILYSYARANSILKKAKNKKHSTSFKKLENKEIEIIKKFSEFKSIIEKSEKEKNPAYIANYTYQLSKIFNEFYHSCPVISSKQEALRLSIVKAFKIISSNSCNLLGIKMLEKM